MGATPIFIDVEESSNLIDLDQVEAAMTRHDAGDQGSDPDPSLRPARRHGAVQRHRQAPQPQGCRGLRPSQRCQLGGPPDRQLGRRGLLQRFPTKNLGGAGDGGVVTFKDEALAQQMQEHAVHGMPRRHLHSELGYNSVHLIHAAVLNVKRPQLGSWVEKGTAIAKRYRTELSGSKGFALPEAGPTGHSWNQFVVRVPACGSSCTTSADRANFGLPEAY